MTSSSEEATTVRQATKASTMQVPGETERVRVEEASTEPSGPPLSEQLGGTDEAPIQAEEDDADIEVTEITGDDIQSEEESRNTGPFNLGYHNGSVFILRGTEYVDQASNKVEAEAVIDRLVAEGSLTEDQATPLRKQVQESDLEQGDSVTITFSMCEFDGNHGTIYVTGFRPLIIKSRSTGLRAIQLFKEELTEYGITIDAGSLRVAEEAIKSSSLPELTEAEAAANEPARAIFLDSSEECGDVKHCKLYAAGTPTSGGAIAFSKKKARKIIADGHAKGTLSDVERVSLEAQVDSSNLPETSDVDTVIDARFRKVEKERHQRMHEPHNSHLLFAVVPMEEDRKSQRDGGITSSIAEAFGSIFGGRHEEQGN